jgi:hypothetical protein
MAIYAPPYLTDIMATYLNMIMAIRQPPNMAGIVAKEERTYLTGIMAKRILHTRHVTRLKGASILDWKMAV